MGAGHAEHRRLPVDGDGADPRLDHDVGEAARGGERAALPQDSVSERGDEIEAVRPVHIGAVDEDLLAVRQVERDARSHPIDGGREQKLLGGGAARFGDAVFGAGLGEEREAGCGQT
ncbi:MAG: hypothetical protein RIM80_03150 [Alphaproteobacteria bacterium]